jgi:DMSO reductase anchor subunit
MNLLKIGNYILNFIVLGSVVTFTILFYFKIKINFLTNLIIIISIIALFFKLLYWHLLKKTAENKTVNKSKLFLLRLAFCIFTYIMPLYYIIQQPKLVMSDHVISITLIIISIFVFIGIAMERYIFFIESSFSNNSFFEKK